MIEILLLIVDIIMWNIQMIQCINNKITHEKIAATQMIVVIIYYIITNIFLKNKMKNNYRNKTMKIL